MAKLSKKELRKAAKLQSGLSTPFSLCFRDKLQSGYTFDGLTSRQLKEWQNFLDLVSQMSFEQVERRFRRASDSSDSYQGEQVTHYAVSQTFRIHGVIENAQFVVLRLDPSHKFHGG